MGSETMARQLPGLKQEYFSSRLHNLSTDGKYRLRILAIITPCAGIMEYQRTNFALLAELPKLVRA